MLPAIISTMRHLIIFLLTISNLLFAQGKKREYISISADSIDLIELIDHQNLNYDWLYGRTYQIKKVTGKYILTRTDQYNKPFSFGEPSLDSTKDTVNLDQMTLLDQLAIEKNKDSLTTLANSVIASRHPWYSDRIKLENVKIPTEIGEIDDSKIVALLNAITAKEESFINNYLFSLGIDSVWLNENASRLWDLYKPDRFKVSEKARDYCVRCLKNLEYARKASYAIQGSSSTSDYPFVEIRLINEKDTVFINTDGQKPFMLPWNVNEKYQSFNPQISIALADILPYDDYSNRGRLLGYNGRREHSFEGLLTTGIIYDHCVDQTKKWKKWRLKE
jgi:hypothetical protein